MKPASALLTILTRTPLHVGTGASVGAIDQPIIRERHTALPVIPASTLKGVFADWWNEIKQDEQADGKPPTTASRRSERGAELFGSEDANAAAAGALLFGEGGLAAFPIRSARGSFAWITSPLILRRLAKAGGLGIPESAGNLFDRLKDNDQELTALFAPNSIIALGTSVILEEYTFASAGSIPEEIAEFFQSLHDEPIWKDSVAKRLVIVPDGAMSFLTRTATEVAQHVRINDETGTAAEHALFNQENVPSEALFYSIIHALDGRGKSQLKAKDALDAFSQMLAEKGHAAQIGGDASTGLGYCSLHFKTLN